MDTSIYISIQDIALLPIETLMATKDRDVKCEAQSHLASSSLHIPQMRHEHITRRSLHGSFTRRTVDFQHFVPLSVTN